jgi:flagellar L-ring protein precursor FlgH
MFPILLGLLLLSPASMLARQGKGYDELYARYLAAARQPSAAPAPLWMTDLMTDPVARRMNDIVTVRVIESVSAAGSADSRTGKASSADVTFPPGRITDALGHILPTSSETKFTGSGGTTRTTELSAVMTARVVEVLPNGDLVVEGVRELDINGDRNLIVLTGVIRSIDILPGNVIPSTRIGQLRIRSLSQGLIKDSLSPGWLIRVLNKIF